jgi:glycosyltransferase involved in cell wall biosynthesis
MRWELSPGMPAASGNVDRQQPRIDQAQADGPALTRFVCMVAYTDYSWDARVRREAETLASHGFQVLCLTPKTAAEQERSVLNGVEIRELRVRKYQGKSALAYLRSYLHFLLATSAACVGLLLKGELDVVHIHNLPDFLVLAGLLPRLAGSKVVLDVHDSVPETFATKFSNAPIVWKALCLEERLSAFVAHKVICVNRPQQEALVARGIPEAKTFISMNVPDPGIFGWPSKDDEPVTRSGSFNLVYHGSMVDRLGVDLLIRAAALLRERIRGLRLHLWGSGDDLSKFQNLVQELGMEDSVSFAPKGYPLHELPSRLRSMDLGVVGNRRSAASDLMLPVKLMEYVALGIPTVVPRLRTIEYYFAEDMVAYYEPENVQSLADSIDRLCCQPELRSRQAEQARKFLREYGWDRQGAELVTFYQQLVKKPGLEEIRT